MKSKYNNFTENIKRDYLEKNLTIQEINEKYEIKSHCFVSKVLGDLKRTRSEASKIARLKHPESYVMSDKTKEKLRVARNQFLKEHPEATAWRRNNEPSYPEKCFINFLTEKEYDKKYYIEREYPIFPYYIDFAFVDEKIAVEIDGSQHLADERAESDRQKDKLLIEKGWKVLRVTEFEIKNNWENVELGLKKLLNVPSCTYEKVGILMHRKKQRTPKQKNEYGRTLKQDENCVKNRIVKDRPNKNELIDILKKEKSFVAVGKRYGVSDNTIRKWCKWYKIPHTIKNYKT